MSLEEEKCVSYDEKTGACKYPKSYSPTGCVKGRCTTNGLCDGCNKAYPVNPAVSSELHVLVTEQGQDKVVVLKYPPELNRPLSKTSHLW